MTNKFHFMTDKFHLMTEPTEALFVGEEKSYGHETCKVQDGEHGMPFVSGYSRRDWAA